MQSWIRSRFTLPGLIIVTFLCVLVITLLTCVVGADLLTRHLVKHDAELVGDLARLLLTESIPASYFTQASPADPSLYGGTFVEIVASAAVVRVVLYDATARVLWSDDATMIGRRFVGNPELDRALRGEIEAHIIRPGKEEHQGKLRAFQRVEEIYLPVRYARDGPVVGVLEIYRHPPKFFEVLDRGLALVWILGGGGGLLLYATVLATARLAVVETAPARGRSMPRPPYVITGTDAGAQWSGEPYRSLMESLRDVVCRVAPDGAIVSLNSAFQTVTGWPSAEWLGRPFAELLHPDDRLRVSGWLHALARGERPPLADLRLRSRSGESIPGDLTGTPVFEEGKVAEVAVVVRDLGGQTRAEAALRKSEQRFRTLVDTARDMIFTLSPEGTFTSLNPAFETITGWPGREWIGRPFTTLIHSDDASRALALLAGFLRGEQPPVYQVRVLSRGGEYRTCEVTATLRTRDGSVIGSWGIARDITERKRREEALRRLNERLEGEVKRIAHELHDEAGQLLAAAYIALADMEREAPPSVREPLHDLRGVLDEIEENLRQLAHELRPTILDHLGLGPAFELLAQGVARRTGLRVTVKANVEARLPPVIEISLYRVVQESLTNVVKHARASEITIRVGQEAQGVRCEIRDDGVGFDVAAVLGGTGAQGLGLTGNIDRIEALGGTFHIVSSPGEGTEVIITVPLEA